MTTEVFLTALIPSVLCGIILLVIGYGQKKAQEREESRERRELLTLESLNANFKIDEQLARCIRGEKPNGDLTDALKYQKEIKHKLDDYIREQAAKI